eukprot:9100766-Alexandrium_andersonii.AAC.1
MCIRDRLNRIPIYFEYDFLFVMSLVLMIITALTFMCGCACGCCLRPCIDRRIRRWFNHTGPDLRIHITSSGAAGLRYH